MTNTITVASEQLAAWLTVGTWWLAPLLALAAGVITSFLPCCLSSIPLVVGIVGGSEAGPRRGFAISAVFSLGMALTMTILGTAAAILGRLMGITGQWFYIALGILMVVMSLQMFGILNVLPGTHLLAKTKQRGYIGAFIAGILGGLFSSPCATPVLVVILGLVAAGGNIAWGIVLLLCYSLGHSALVMIVGTSMGAARKITSSSRYKIIAKALQICMGILALTLGIYLLYLGL